MGRTAIIIAVSYGIAVVLGVLIALAVWRSTRTRGPADPEKLAQRERTWLIVVVVLLLALLLGTIFYLPYGKSAPGNRQIVNVTARQFAWQIRPAVVRAGVPVEFRLRSQDVNHGFGIYTSADELLFQVQVVPGKTQKVVHTFRWPGVYRVLCLEFCGLLHHEMLAQFEVRG